MWRKGNPYTLLMEMETGATTMENSISSVQFSRSVVSDSLEKLKDLATLNPYVFW